MLNKEPSSTLSLTEKQQNTLSSVLPFYYCSLDNCKINPLGNGLINETFLVESPQQNFVLQRINTHVFPIPADVINNAELIHQHLHNKTLNNTYLLHSIGHIKNINQEPVTYYNNEYWRALDYIADSITIEHIENTEQAEQVANAFAQFSVGLSDLDATQLTETIPNFHHLNTRLQQFTSALNEATPTRKNESQLLINVINNNQRFIEEVNKISAHLPLRVTHNDTKINNLLFSKTTNIPLAVIDLDTCMPGFLMNDFGDLIRTCCPNVDENSTQLDKMHIRMDLFKAMADSYINVFKTSITQQEKESLVIGSQLIPFMLAVRFLTDHLNGNIYFQTAYPEQNLDRAKNQFHLFSLLREKHNELMSIINTSDLSS